MLNTFHQEAANCLKLNKSLILSEWMREVGQSIPAAGENTKPAIRDHIPELIDQLIKCLTISGSDYRDKLIDIAKEHGRQRNSLPSYTIDQVVSEYRILRRRLLDTITNHDKRFPPELQTLLNDFIDDCIEFAVAEFSRVSQNEVEQFLLRSSKSEDELRLKQADLEQALRVRDEFLSIASHELKTPLTALYLQLQLLDRTVKRKSEALIARSELTPTLAKSVQQTNRIIEMLDRLLDLSRIRNDRFHLETTAVDMCGLLRDVLSRMSAQIETTGIDIELEMCDEAIAYVDPLRIEQVMTNLLSNAMKYGDGNPVSIKLRRLDDNVVITVRDRGIGIASEDQPKIFKRYARVTEVKKSESMGLGLYIVFEIITAHGGTIEVQSELGKGTVFTIVLPTKRIAALT